MRCKPLYSIICLLLVAFLFSCSKNAVEFDEYDETDSVHEYTLIITDANKIDKRELNLKVFITLRDNTDFTLKFE